MTPAVRSHGTHRSTRASSPSASRVTGGRRRFAEQFFSLHNHGHRHSGIGLHTPASVHFGTVGQVRAQRQSTLDAAYAAHPSVSTNRRPQAPKLPQAA